MNKVVKVTKCEAKLQFVKHIKEVTHKNLHEVKCIADSLIAWKDGEQKSVGTLLLNESSITPEQWEEIVKRCERSVAGLEWNYVEV